MSTDTPQPTEAEMLNRITSGLKRECKRRDIALRPGDAIKKQKYVDLALEEFLGDISNPPVTMSWFRFGRTTPAGGGGTVLPQPKTTVSPTNKSDSVAEFLAMEAADFQEFYRAGTYEPSLQYANEPLLPFLRQYYLSHAPDRFRELYLVNVRLREALQEVRLASNPDTEQQLTTQHGEQLYRNVTRLTSQLELLLSDDFVYYPVTTVIPQYLRLVEQSFAGIAALGVELATHERFTFVLELEGFYEKVVWAKIAHCLSRETAVGPNADALKSKSRNALCGFEDGFSTEVDDLKDECIRVGTFPTPSEYPTRTDEATSTLAELLRIASKPTKDGETNNEQTNTDNYYESTDQ